MGIKKVGVFDNYFELGGNSLSASQAVYRMKETFKVEIPLSKFFKEASVSALAEFIETFRWLRENQSRSFLIKQESCKEIGISQIEEREIVDI